MGKRIVAVDPMVAIKLKRDMTANSSEVAEIKQHIANLRKIENEDYGYSSTMEGTAFPPLPFSENFEGGILMDHGLKTSDDVIALVASGPKALPFLLAALSDDTPTKLMMKQPFQEMGAMYFSDELDANLANSNEVKAVNALPKHDDMVDFNNSTNSYSFKVGDICFAVIGEIVGRKYFAVRYQMTACVVINSPIQNPALAKQVRTVWASTNSTQTLLDSLLLDYSAKLGYTNFLGVLQFNHELQPGAAMRLLYYFPHESEGMIAERLSGLDVNGYGNNVTNLIHRDTFNEVRTEDLIKAVSWSDSFAVRKAVLDIFKRTTDPDILLASLPGIYPNMNDLVHIRLAYFIDRLPPVEEGPYGDGYNLLVALGGRLGEQAKPIFVEYMKNASPQRRQTMELVLKETQPQWKTELLGSANGQK